jgi:hypothetical protein
MYTGQIFKLRKATVGIDEGGGIVIEVPSGSLIKVISGPNPNDPMVHVVCAHRRLSMFAIDVNERGQEVADHSSNFNLCNA